jgi:hypothetical protein
MFGAAIERHSDPLDGGEWAVARQCGFDRDVVVIDDDDLCWPAVTTRLHRAAKTSCSPATKQ